MKKKSKPNGPDFRNIKDQDDVKKMKFPGQVKEFRVHIAEEAYKSMKEHASTTCEVELCGVLVGEICKDDQGFFLNITNVIEGVGTNNCGTQVTFTHETWNDINEKMDKSYSDKKVVGWYHTHPGFGIFLSDMDTFIQKNFFSQPYQVAIVIDPRQKQEGCFVWQEGEIVKLTSYWIGDEKVALKAQIKQKEKNIQEDEELMENDKYLSLIGKVLFCIIIFIFGWLWGKNGQKDIIITKFRIKNCLEDVRMRLENIETTEKSKAKKEKLLAGIQLYKEYFAPEKEMEKEVFAKSSPVEKRIKILEIKLNETQLHLVKLYEMQKLLLEQKKQVKDEDRETDAAKEKANERKSKVDEKQKTDETKQEKPEEAKVNETKIKANGTKEAKVNSDKAKQKEPKANPDKAKQKEPKTRVDVKPEAKKEKARPKETAKPEAKIGKKQIKEPEKNDKTQIDKKNEKKQTKPVISKKRKLEEKPTIKMKKKISEGKKSDKKSMGKK